MNEIDSTIKNSQLSRVNILGVYISAINMIQAKALIHTWIENRNSQYVCVTPAHGVMDCYYDSELQSIFNASGMTTPDGMVIVWLLKLHGYKQVSRVYGPDLMLAICEQSVQYGYRHYFYGGKPGVPEQLARRLQKRFPGLQVVGFYSPPFRDLTPEEDTEIVNLINSSKADIVWIGISTPKQERWMASHVKRVNAPILIGVGAAFDFLSGNKKQAPRWMQHSGLEWLFRFLSEPRRLWRRYILYPKFVLLATGQLIQKKIALVVKRL